MGTTHTHNMSSKDSSMKDKKAPKKAISRSAKAGLQFPVGRIHRFLKQRVHQNGSFGARWQCFQRFESEAYHSSPSSTCNPWRRRARHTDQGHHCWWWCNPSYSQVADQQEQERLRSLASADD